MYGFNQKRNHVLFFHLITNHENPKTICYTTKSPFTDSAVPNVFLHLFKAFHYSKNKE